jgi:transposase
MSDVVMVVDGASSHRAKALEIPDNISLIRLPPYSPELNPTEILWHELREKCCANRVFETLDAVCQEVESGLRKLASVPEDVTRLSGWPWILNSIVMNAT